MALNSKTILFVCTALAILAAGFLVYVYYPMAPKNIVPNTTQPASGATVTIGTTTIAVEVESTETSREQGLSGRTSLAEGSGMLFVFQTPGTYGFWMKDMNFDLDMIFADSNRQIITIARDATAASYHQNPPQVFYPSAPILYVLEVPAGFADAHNIQEGMTLQIH